MNDKRTSVTDMPLVFYHSPNNNKNRGVHKRGPLQDYNKTLFNMQKQQEKKKQRKEKTSPLHPLRKEKK